MGTLFGRTLGLVAVTVGLFALGAYLARNLSGGWAMAFWIASFVCLLAMKVTVRQSEQFTLGLLFGFGLLVGAGHGTDDLLLRQRRPRGGLGGRRGDGVVCRRLRRRRLRRATRPFCTRPSALVGADRADWLRHAAHLLLDPGRLSHLCAARTGDLRRPGDVRLPAATRQHPDRQRPAAGGLDLSRHPQRLPVLPHAVRSEAPLTAHTGPRTTRRPDATRNHP